MTQHQRKPRELTGRTVLFWLVAFFGVVFAVNGVMVQRRDLDLRRRRDRELLQGRADVRARKSQRPSARTRCTGRSTASLRATEPARPCSTSRARDAKGAPLRA